MADKKKRRLITRTIILSVLIAAVAYTLYANMTKEKHGKIAVGDQAPDFVLSDMNGDKYRLSELQGKGVFINFWATWCKPCKREMPSIQNQYEEYKDQGVEVLAVNMGDPAININNFLKDYEFTFPILHDKNKDIGSSVYQRYKLPATILVDADGEIVEIVEGELPEGRIKAMMEKIKP